MTEEVRASQLLFSFPLSAELRMKKKNGDYAPGWEQMDYTTDEENHIACSALVVNGMNDINVTTRHAELMVEAFQKAGKAVKLVLHQGGHMTLSGYSINGMAWDELMNLWLSHYLYGGGKRRGAPAGGDGAEQHNRRL